MIDPVSAVAAGNAVLGSARGNRARAKGNASNVILLTEAKPRQPDGYRIICDVINRSAIGISEIAISIQMHVGQLDLSGEILSQAMILPKRAVAGGDTASFEFPHVASGPSLK